MFRAVILMAWLIVLAAAPTVAQTAATGAVTGTVRDQTGSTDDLRILADETR
jgi:hypothetical protein